MGQVRGVEGEEKSGRERGEVCCAYMYVCVCACDAKEIMYVYLCQGRCNERVSVRSGCVCVCVVKESVHVIVS